MYGLGMSIASITILIGWFLPFYAEVFCWFADLVFFVPFVYILSYPTAGQEQEVASSDMVLWAPSS